MLYNPFFYYMKSVPLIPSYLIFLTKFKKSELYKKSFGKVLLVLNLVTFITHIIVEAIAWYAIYPKTILRIQALTGTLIPVIDFSNDSPFDFELSKKFTFMI